MIRKAIPTDAVGATDFWLREYLRALPSVVGAAEVHFETWLGMLPRIRAVRVDGAVRTWDVRPALGADGVHAIGLAIRAWFVESGAIEARESAWDWWHALADLHGEPA